MKKAIISLLLFSTIFLSGCETIFNNVADEIYQNLEIDHLELISNERIEILVGTEELPDLKVYVNRVDPDGKLHLPKTFEVNALEVTLDIVGEYEIEYSFMSFEEMVYLTVTIYVVEELNATEITE